MLPPNLSPAVSGDDGSELLKARANLAKAIPDLRDRALQGICDELSALSSLIDVSTTGVTDQFQSIAADTTQQTTTIRNLIVANTNIEIDGSVMTLAEIASSLQAALSDLVSKIVFLSSRGMTMVYTLEDVLLEMKRVADSVGQIERINSRTNMLALNAKIEAVHAGPAGRGFSVVANEVRELASHTNEISQQLFKRIHTVRTGLEDSFSLLREISTIDMSEANILANERIKIIIEALVQQHSRFTGALEDASRVTGRVTDEINSVVTKLQFQDRATQNIQNVQSVVEAVRLSLSESDAESEHHCLISNITSKVTLGDMRRRILARIEGQETAPASTPETDADIELF